MLAGLCNEEWGYGPRNHAWGVLDAEKSDLLSVMKGEAMALWRMHEVSVALRKLTHYL